MFLRPPRPAVLPGAGGSGSRIAHWASVSADEGWKPQVGGADTSAEWAGHDEQTQAGDNALANS
jgi:hypothetical protein